MIHLTMHNFFSRLQAKTEGSVLVIAAIGIPLMIIVAGMSVDINRYLTLRSRMATALDTAVLSAATVIDTQNPSQIANEYFLANLPQGYQNEIILNGGSNPVNLSPDNAAAFSIDGIITGRVSAKINNSFASFLGISTLDVNLISTAKRDVAPQVEIALTADISPSMCARTLRNSPAYGSEDSPIAFQKDTNCTKLKAMQSAMSVFVERMSENVRINKMGIGIVPYTHKVRFPNGSVPPELSSVEPAGYYSDFSDAALNAGAYPAIYSLTSPKGGNLSPMQSWIQNELRTDPGAPGWTRSNIGALSARFMLDPAYSGYFANQLTPAPFFTPNVNKSIIMMTDGPNISCCYSSYPVGDYSNQYLYIYKPDNDHLKQVCDDIAAQGIQIFTVLFDVHDLDKGGSDIQDLYHYCASPTGDPASFGFTGGKHKPNFFDVQSTDNDALSLAYLSIAQSFFKLRLIK